MAGEAAPPAAHGPEAGVGEPSGAGRVGRAEWAGHSVAVLLQIYAKCIAGQDDAARRRIAAALGEG